MEWNVPNNLTRPEDFWALWQADQSVFAVIGLVEGAERSGVAALALLVWDILTTMDEEVKLIWRSSWTVPKFLYFFVRYYSLITLILHNIRVIPCAPWLIFEIVSTLLVELAAELIIIFRVYAVYGGQQKILRLMQLGFALQVAIMAVSLGVSMPKIATGFYCKAADLPAEMVIFSTASIMYETFLFGLMMVGVIRGSKIGLSDTALLRVIVRDGAMAFVGIYLVMLLNTILFTMAPTTLVTLGFPWLLAIVGALGSRLVLNVRAKHATKITSPSTIADLQLKVPTHLYSSVHLDDLEGPRRRGSLDDTSSWDSEDEDSDSDREDSALNPSRQNSYGSSGRNRHSRAPSDVPSDISGTPSSPLTPITHFAT
ncbi:hypothetical protein C8Q76DRAFT_700025 [Earliella scabrosa]|nr:hypothetical protein C8Q76DRAFT_700025 [Earliella scabrosa]